MDYYFNKKIFLELLKCLENNKDKKNNIPIAAAIVDENNNIISISSNINSKNTIFSHAEIIVLEDAIKKIKNNKLYNYSIWITMEPCMMCLGGIINSGIKKIYYYLNNKKHGFIFSNHTFDLSKFYIFKINNIKKNNIFKKKINSFFLKKRNNK